MIPSGVYLTSYVGEAKICLLKIKLIEEKINPANCLCLPWY